MIALAAALYLFDCVVLLERGQAFWSHAALFFGSNNYQIRGRPVTLLNPFTPFVPVARTQPLFAAPAGPKLSTAMHALTPLTFPAAVQFVLVFVALPWCLYRAPGWPFFLALVLAYLNAVAMLVLIWWRFRAAGLARRPLLALGFAWLACLPLSVNCLRKAGLAFDIALDARRALRFLPASGRQRARDEFEAQIAEAMQEVDEGDERYRRLDELMRELKRQPAPEAGHGRV